MRLQFTPKQIERFWSCVPSPITLFDCWEWNGRRDKHGYGLFSANVERGKDGHFFAHRVMWFFVFGEFPENKGVCHSCDNPRCVNPWHLWEGTQRQNALDMILKGRDACMRTGSNKPSGHKRPDTTIRCTGSNHHFAKMTEQSVREARGLFDKGGITSAEIARTYGLSNATMNKILKRQLWKHVD